MIHTVKKVIEEKMIQEDHYLGENSAYKEGTLAFTRLLDWLERFVEANKKLIADHEDKVKKGKKTRRIIPDKLFIETTEVMAKLREIFTDVTIRAVSGHEATVLTYYSELTGYDRQMYDSRRAAD